mgnify:CR=1 FL=1
MTTFRKKKKEDNTIFLTTFCTDVTYWGVFVTLRIGGVE